MKWISVRETMPVYGKSVLTWNPIWQDIQVSTLTKEVEGERWCGHWGTERARNSRITHWAHIPDPPRTA